VVNLSVANLLVALLEIFKISSLLTRKQEVYVSLGERCEAANDWGANYFVSIHCNSDSDAFGIETLYKTEKGKALATPVQEALVQATGDRDRGLKHRTDLYVLNGTYMPSILPEIGFISHPATEEKLGTAAYQESIAQAIYRGLAKHLGLNVEALK
jgi:N-acetylmuramoyl-L-alanine amidase